jgi:GNAT superfamily N-acetyltransferase
MAEVTVRAAIGEADLQAVRTLMREYAAHLAESAARICLGAGYEAELAGLPAPYVTPGGLLLAEVGGHTAGCVAIKPVVPRGAANSEGQALEVKRLWVRPGFRGLRLGLQLIEAAVSHARAAGSTAMYLDTVPAAMPEANRLYAALGFQQVARYNDNPVADVAFFRLAL